MRRTFGWIAAVGAAALVAMGLLPAGAGGSGGLSATPRWIVNVNSLKVVDLAGGSAANGAPAIQWTKHGGQNQQWQFEAISPGFYRIRNVASGKVLDVQGGSTANGAPIIQWTQHDGDNQRWTLVTSGDATSYRIRNVATQKVMDVNQGSTADGAPIVQWTLHDGPNQRWVLPRVTEPLP